MAGDWLKLEITTPDKPEIFELASRLMIDDNDTVLGKVIRVWLWFDQHTEEGHAPRVTKMFLDRVTGVKGFCDALVAVGWMEESGDKISLPKFDRHNGETAKRRAENNRRKARSRAKSQNSDDKCHTKNVTPDVTKVSTREEKRIYTDRYTEIGQIHTTLASEGLNEKWLMRVEDRKTMASWIEAGLTGEILAEAVARARHSKQGDPFGVAYLNRIVEQLIFEVNNPGKPYEKQRSYGQSGSDILAAGCADAFEPDD